LVDRIRSDTKPQKLCGNSVHGCGKNNDPNAQ